MAEPATLNSAPSQGTSPDVSGKSSGDILSMINGANQVQSPQPANPANEPVKAVDPNAPKTEPVKPDPNAVQIPDKFKNPDGTLNTDNLLKSYLEAEKGLSKQANVSHETNQKLAEAEIYKKYAEDLKAKLDQTLAQNQAPKNTESSEYTEEEIKLIQENPRAWLRQELAKELQAEKQKSSEESSKQREQDYMMLTAINKARETLPAFAAVENEIKELANQEWVGNDPKAIETLYYAAIGKKNEGLVAFAVEKARKEAYEQAKKDIQMQVDGGGRDSAPVDVGTTVSAAKNATTEELGKMLPRTPRDY
jgi:hypothetical protein